MSTREQRALHLVGEYSRLQCAIKACKSRIGDRLDQCAGIQGFRKEVVRMEAVDGGAVFGWIEAYEQPSDRAMKDQETHLARWFTPEVDDDGRYWDQATPEECPHCFAAYEIVQERKKLRRSLAGVKAAMTKFGGAA